jgi:hypothetical protein
MVPAWLLPADACPADVLGAHAEIEPWDGMCDDLTPCLRRCEAREPTACYASALRVEELGVNRPLADALFLRTCVLGIESGCTNRAASIFAREPDRQACGARTFELTCARGDQWGCAMFGMALAIGKGTAKDPERAVEALERACSIAPEHDACAAARSVLEQLRSPGGGEGGS